jgi:hypothetical protein
MMLSVLAGASRERETDAIPGPSKALSVPSSAPRRRFDETPFPWSTSSKRKSAILTHMIAEIDIWRVAVLMLKRYAEDAEANADRRADELETEGDYAGAAILGRVTVAIEQLTDTTGP